MRINSASSFLSLFAAAGVDHAAHPECLGFGFNLTAAGDCFAERRIMIA
jgi:hypothetical protein